MREALRSAREHQQEPLTPAPHGPLPIRAAPATPAQQLLAMQRTAGNRAVHALIQAKLNVSQPNDPLEVEADRIADEVMRMPDPAPARGPCGAVCGSIAKCRGCAQAPLAVKRRAASAPLLSRMPMSFGRSYSATVHRQSATPLLPGPRPPEPRWETPTAAPRDRSNEEKAKEKLSEALARFALEKISESAFGGAALERLERDLRPITSAVETFMESTLGQVLAGAAGAGDVAALWVAGYNEKEAEEEPARAFEPPSAPKIEETLFKLSLDWDFLSTPSNPRLSLPKGVLPMELNLPPGGESTVGGPTQSRRLQYPSLRWRRHPETERREAAEAEERILLYLVANRDPLAQALRKMLRRAQTDRRGALKGGAAERFPRLPLLFKRQADASLPADAAFVAEAGLASPGRPLDPQARAFMEARFGHDFGDVRVHNDAAAAVSARAFQARAYTLGRDIVFATGLYVPETAVGRTLLAHELAHTIQQGSCWSVRRRMSPPPRDIGLKRLEKKVSILSRIDNIYKLMDRSKNRWDLAYSSIGRAYYTAYNEHKKTLLDQDRNDALYEAVAFAVLTTMLIGAVGWLGEYYAASTKMLNISEPLRKFIAGGLEDTLQAALSEAIDVTQIIIAPQVSIISVDPYLFEKQLKDSNTAQWIEVQSYFINIQESIDRKYEDDPASFDYFDISTLLIATEMWRISNRMMKNPKMHNTDDLSRELERGIWAKWVNRLKEIEYDPYILAKIGIMSPRSPVYKKLGSRIEEQLDKLSIPSDAGIGKTFKWYWTTSDQIEKLVLWGERFKPRKFSF